MEQSGDYIFNDAGADIIRSLNKELRRTRIFCAVLSVLMICVLAGVVFLINRLEPVYLFIEEAQPVLEQISRLDVEAANDALVQFSSAVGEVDWGEVSDNLGRLDVEALNEALNGLDMEKLSVTLENMNDAVEMLKSLGEKLGFLSRLF